MLTFPLPASSASRAVELTSGPLTAAITLDPFAVSFSQHGERIVSTATATGPARSSPGALGLAVGAAAERDFHSYLVSESRPVWFRATRARRLGPRSVEVATDDPQGRTFTVSLVAVAPGAIEIRARPSDPAGVLATGFEFARNGRERFLGLGERSDAADQTGRVAVSWSEEGPWSAGALTPATDPVFGERWQGPEPFAGTNFPMPWFVSSKGYGFLLGSTWLNELDLASTRADRWRATTREPALRFRVYAGPTPAKALARFSRHVGRQPRPAEWFFGEWLRPPGPQRAETGEEMAPRWREWDVPVTVAQTGIHYLPRGDHLRLSRERRREIPAIFQRYGYKVTTYVSPWVCRGHFGGAYEAGDRAGHFVKTAAGTSYPVYQVSYLNWPECAYFGLVDFTSPEAAAWWRSLVDDATRDGYDGWMEDFGEYVPPDARMADGRSGLAAHNDYCTRYHAASQALTRPRFGREFGQFVRCGYTGTARHARIVWGGDPGPDWSKADGLGAAVSQGLSMGLSGVGYWGSDTGGFLGFNLPTAEVRIRWIELSAFSGWMGGGSDFKWDPEIRPVWRKFAKLRTQLFPYIWNAAREYRRSGMPIMRHLALRYPDDPRVYDPVAEYEYLFGPDLLVAPVIEPGATRRTLYLPRGRWYDFWKAVGYDERSGAFKRTGPPRPIAGGRTVTVAAPLDRIPLFVRAGTCLRLLPAETDTLSREATVPGIDTLRDARGRERTLAFGGRCRTARR